MEFFRGTSGLARAKEVYHDRNAVALESKRKGGTIIGYHCCYVPVELLTAAGVVPFRITGDIHEKTSYADSVLETQMCPYVRNCFEMALKQRYQFLDGMVIPHVCDAVERIYGFWRHYVGPAYLHQLDVPHVLGAAAYQFFSKELSYFKTTLEQLTGRHLGRQELSNAIRLHNENRVLVKQLYELRRRQPPLLSGVEVLQVMVSGVSLPVTEFNELLRQVIQEVSSRPSTCADGSLRLLVYGCVVDNLALLELIESYGARVVMDDLPIGTRTFWFQVDEGLDPLEAIARAYLVGVRCPRTIVGEKTKPYKEEIAERFQYVLDYAREFNVGGAVLYALRFCDPHQFDIPDLVDYLREAGVPVLVLDDDYTVGNIGRLRTRVESFLETLR